MRRLTVAPRPDWQKTVEGQGLLFHTTERPYWNEGVFYEFKGHEIDAIERVTNDLQGMCLEAVARVIETDRFADLHIPPQFVPLIKRAWEEEPPSVYGRFDFAYDGESPPQLLEYNADTPTSLLEAGLVQWLWLQDVLPGSDQFNSIHERLVSAWAALIPHLKSDLVHFAHVEDIEDMMTVSYLREVAQQAGLRTQGMLMSEIGWNSTDRRFLDLDEKPIGNLFKLYPWEWLVHEDFGVHISDSYDEMVWIEPIWKMILSNKGILAILWEMFEGHPNLLEAYLQHSGEMWEYARKPLLSREGANVTLKTAEQFIETGGDYGEEGFVYQALAPIPNMDGNHPVIGSWVIAGEAAGMGIRESDGMVTDNMSRFVPHAIA